MGRLGASFARRTRTHGMVVVRLPCSAKERRGAAWSVLVLADRDTPEMEIGRWTVAPAQRWIRRHGPIAAWLRKIVRPGLRPNGPSNTRLAIAMRPQR